MAAFVPYLVVGAVGLIGEWLIGPGKSNKSPMPQLNQSLRGSPIYVTFGTNRVDAQVVWTANWKAVRGSGSKKGGGSGGLGSAKAGAQSGYTYFWDVVLHYGFVDVPCFIGRGWVGNDPVRRDQIETFDAGIPGADFTLIGSHYTSVNSNTVKLYYTEANVNPGYPTGDTQLETWPYFASQTGLNCAWPSTFWIGFRQFNLGQSAQLPQLGLELVPTNILFAPTLDGFEGLTSNALSNYFQGASYNEDDSGVVWVGQGGGVAPNVLSFVTPANTGLVAVTLTQFQSDAVALSLPLASDASFSWVTTLFIPGTPYAYVMAETLHAANQLNCLGVCYKIETNGTISRQGGFSFLYAVLSGGRLFDAHVAAIGCIGNQEVSIAYWSATTGSGDGFTSNRATWLMSLPNPTTILGSTTINTGLPPKFAEITEVGQSFLCNRSNRNFTDDFRTHIPGGFVDAQDGTNYWFFRYVSAEEFAWQAAHSAGTIGYNAYMAGLASTYPSGCMFGTKFGGGSYSGMAAHNDYFQDVDGSNMVPFADEGFNKAGIISGSPYDCYYPPNASDSAHAMITRPYSDDHYSCRVRMFLNYGDHAVLSTTITGPYATQADLGEGSSLPVPSSIIPYLSSSFGIYVAIQYDGSSFNPGRTTSLFGQIDPHGLDVTPAYIIKRILTSKVWGFQTDALFGYSITDATINQISYEDAVQYCVDNGIYVSVTYNGQDSILNTINELLSLYNGYVVEHGGVVYFGVVRANDVPMRTIDNTRLISPGPGKPPVNVTKGAAQDGYNIVEFQYLDRSLEYQQNQIWVSDEVDIDFTGPRVKTYQAKFVMSGSTAFQCAERALWSNLYGKDNYAFQLGVKDADLRPGMQVTLVDSFDNTLSAGVQAIITEWKENKRFTFDVKAVRVYDDHLTSTHAFTDTGTPGQGIGSMVQDVAPPIAMRAYELPTQFQQSQAFMYVGYNQGSLIMGSQLWLSATGTTFTQVDDVQPFPISGLLAQPLPVRPCGYVERGIKIVMMPSSLYSVATPTFVQTSDIEDTAMSARQAGLTCMIVGSEAIAIEGAVLTGQNQYTVAKAYRGWGGTPISAQNSGAYWHHHGDGMFAHPIGIADIGKIIYYKVLPYNFAGDVLSISSVTANTYMIRGDYWLPREQPPTRLYVASAPSWSPNSPIIGPFITVTSGGSDIIMKWRNSANEEGFGFGGFGNAGAGHFTADVTTPSYRVDVMSVNGVKVSSFVVNTGYFDYTVLQNIADFGSPAGKQLAFKVTPFNSLGDGYVADTTSISMTW
jgi:hypothetical protein